MTMEIGGEEGEGLLQKKKLSLWESIDLLFWSSEKLSLRLIYFVVSLITWKEEILKKFM